MRFSFIIGLLFINLTAVFSQDFSNKGKDFWLGYGYHVRYVTGSPVNEQEMVLYFATDVVTNIKIEIPATGYVQNLNNVAAGTIVTSAPIPKSGTQDARLTGEGVFNSGIHVTCDKPVVAYAHIYNGNVSGATLLFPTNTLGKEYYSMNYTQVSNEGASNGFFFAVATDTGTTTIEVTPSASTLTHAAGVPFNVTLTQGQIYNVMGALNGNNGSDLSGSKIRSLSTGVIACKKIAVFSGAGKMRIACTGNANSSDNLFAQAFPKTAWGKKFLTSPTKNMPFNYFRIGVSDPTTVVKVNNVVISGLTANFYYDLPLTDQPKLIEADKPIMVAQYITTTGTCGNSFISDGDPEMIYISPVEQTIDKVLLNSTGNFSINSNQHWVNVIIKTAAVPSFSITNIPGAFSFLPHPQDPSYSYAQINVNSGQHKLEADSGFNAIAYGYGNFESYGYNAGTNLKDLYNYIIPYNPLNISGTNSACACTPFYYTVTYPFQPISLSWNFYGFQPNVLMPAPLIADSTFFINGKQVWQYKVPTPFSYCPAGNYPVSITAATAGTDDCGNFQTKDDTLHVINTPITDFSWTHNGCTTDSVSFNDNTSYEPGTFAYKWYWDFGDGDTSRLQNPKHMYLLPGTYTVKFYLVSNIGCISAVLQKTIIVTSVPVPKFGVSLPLCAGKPVTFSDSSTAMAPGILAKWFWDFGDGVKDTVLTNASQQHTYAVAGTYIVTLKVLTNSGCESGFFSKTIIIHPNPLANFNLPAAVCLPYTAAQFTDASTIADGTQAGFSWAWNFGDPASGLLNTATINNPSHLYNNLGPFNVQLIVTSNNGCIDDTTRILNTVYPHPTSPFTINGVTVNAENCLNTPTAFSSNASGAGSTISAWFWDFGDGTANGSGQTATHTYANAISYTVKHWIRTDKGCLSDTTSQTVVINALPVPSFTFTSPACEFKNITFNNTSTTATGNIIKWIWDFGDGNIDTLLSGAPFTYVYNTAGTFIVKLSTETDKGCKNVLPFVQNVVISPKPAAGFVLPEVCLSDAFAQFIDTSSVASGTITSWAWDFGDPASGGFNTSVLQNPPHRYNAIGNYTATLIITTNNGCKDTIAPSFTVNGDIPVANFNPLPGNFCANDSVAIQNASTVNFGNVTKVDIYWDNANAPAVFETDDFPFSGKIYKHLYLNFQTPATKTFTIRFRAYSGATCINDKIKSVVVNAAPKLVFNAIPDICLDAVPYQITQAIETGGVAGNMVYSGTGVSAGGLFTPLTAGPGTYTIKVVYTSNFGCADSATQTIKVLVPPVANFGYSTPSCQSKNVTFTDSSASSVGTIANRSWNFGDGTPAQTQSAAPFTHVYAGSGTFNVSLTITTSNGCIVTKTKQIIINPNPKPNFTFNESCLPNALVTFTSTSTISDGTENAFTYLWDLGDPASGVNNSSTAKIPPPHLYPAVGPYNIKLTVTSGKGCVSDTTISTGSSIHPEPTADFSSDRPSICVDRNESVQFTDNSNPAGGVLTNWNWNFGDGQIASSQNPAPHFYTSVDTFTVSLQIENNFGCKHTATKPFIVYPNPVVDAGTDKTVLEGGEVLLTAAASGYQLTYLWTPSTYLSATGIIRPWVRNMTVDSITYYLTVTGVGGCNSTDNVFVELLRSPKIPNTFTPNNDGINDKWVIEHLDTYIENRVQIFNRYGQVVFESRGYQVPWDGTYKGKPLPFGTYYYIIEPGNNLDPLKGYVTIIK